MSKRLLQALLVVALVVLAFALRGRGPAAPPATPEAAVSAFFDAAARGDDTAYLALAAGDLRKSLRDSRSQLGTPAFRDGLRRSAAAIKGLATTRSADQPPEGLALDVELVFADRNERQRILLAQSGSGWLLTAIGPAAATKPAIPYGTPVFEEPPARPQPTPPRTATQP